MEVANVDTELDLWCKIKNSLIQELDSDALWFKEALTLSGKQLGPLGVDIKDAASFFDALQKNFEEEDFFDFLFNLFNYMEFHCDYESVAENIKKCKKELLNAKNELQKSGIWMDQNFVGRVREIKETMAAIMEGKFKGVSLCGMGGMGKTSIANKVCLEMWKSRPKWTCIKVDVREKRNILDLLKTTQMMLDCDSVNTYSDVENDEYESTAKSMWTLDNEMKDTVDAICKLRRPTILLFDNVDDILKTEDEKGRFIQFMEKMMLKLSEDPSKTKTKFLITCRQKLLSHRNLLLEKYLTEIEVKQMDEKTAEELFQKCTSKSTYPITEAVCHEFLQFCGYCPLAIRTLCSTLRRSHIPAESFLPKLKAGTQITEVLNMKNRLQPTFESLSEYYQQKLLCLNLFCTGKFTLTDATAVLSGIGDKTEEYKTEEYRTALDLLYLKSQHLLEVDNEVYRREEESRYSLHPLVNHFLKETIRENGDLFSDELSIALERFIDHYYNVVSYTSENHKKDPKSININQISHIRNFYDYLIQSPKGLQKTYSSPLEKESSVSRITYLISFIDLEDDGRFHLYEKQEMHCRNQGDIGEVIRWKTMTANLLFDHSKDDECQIILQDIDNLYDECMKTSDQSSKPVLAAYHFLCGRFFNKCNKYGEAINHLKKATRMYKCLEKQIRNSDISHLVDSYKADLANCYNTQGCVYYKQGDYETSKKFHEMALDNKGDHYQHFNFMANMATCCLALGMEQKDSEEKRDKACREAEKYYSVVLSQYVRNDSKRARHLINRSKLYRLPAMNNFDLAWEDLQAGVKILETVLKPDQEELTVAYHEKGDLQIYWAKMCFREQDSMSTKKHFEEALKWYKQVQEQIEKHNAMSSTSTCYSRIKENHRYVLKTLHMSDEIERMSNFYDRFEAGHFSKSGINTRNKPCLRDDSDSSDNESANSSSCSEDYMDVDCSIKQQADIDTVAMEDKNTSHEKNGGETTDDKHIFITPETKDFNLDLQNQDVDKCEQRRRSRGDSGIGSMSESLRASSSGSSTSRYDGIGSSSSWREPRPPLTSAGSGSMEDVFPDVKLNRVDSTELSFEDIMRKGPPRRSLSSMSSTEKLSRDDSFDASSLTLKETEKTSCGKKELKRQFCTEEEFPAMAGQKRSSSTQEGDDIQRVKQRRHINQ